MPGMTKAERDELSRLVRQRAKVVKATASQRVAELRADFEQQFDTRYSFDQDPIWEEAHNATGKAVEAAQAKVAQRCRELGILKQF
jgi:hypothetical protein